MKNYTLIAVVGKTDPIRSEHDGPILHIIRHYHPKRVVLILSEEIGNDEKKFHYNEKAIQLLDRDCEVISIYTSIKNAHSYDDFSHTLLKTCNEIKEKYQEDTILLNITSGTPQMETAFCMIALSDPVRYVPVQVSTPARGANTGEMFRAKDHSVEEWFAANKDNLKGQENRCHTPELLNFKRPMIQFQIMSLIRHYDYDGAYQIYEDNKKNFSKDVGLLLDHARTRLNLESEKAKSFADKLNMRETLYTYKDNKAEELVEYFNSMRIKQLRGELNDFVLRIEVFTEYLAKYVLEEYMGISIEKIAVLRNRKTNQMYLFDKEKSEKNIPGIDSFLRKKFPNQGRGYEWGKPLNATSLVYILEYMCGRKEYKKYNAFVAEMTKWTYITRDVRNPAAHTIIAITDDLIRKTYDGRGAKALCESIEGYLKNPIILGKKITPSVFKTYECLNQMIKEEMEK